jgi:hypothetical protein
MPRESRFGGSGGSGGGGGSRSRGSHGHGHGNHQQQQSWTHDQAVQLLNDAKLATDASAKTAHLKELQELILHKGRVALTSRLSLSWLRGPHRLSSIGVFATVRPTRVALTPGYHSIGYIDWLS